MSSDPSFDGDSSPVLSEDALRRFPCEACGGQLSWNATLLKLKCLHCEHVQDLQVADGVIEEIDFDRAVREGVGKGYGVSRKSIRCETCGAVTNFDDSATTVRCAFCDSGHVVQEQMGDDLIRPASLVPFQVDKSAALEHFKTWIAGRWLSPGNLKKMWALGEIDGVYLPFWTFDARTASRWTAMAGYYYYVTVSYTAMENGKPVQRTRQEQRVRWRPAAGFYDHDFDDELVYASKGLPRSLVRGLEPYNTTSGLSVYQPNFLAGWKAERYSVDLKSGWTIGRSQIDEAIRAACAAAVPGDTHKDLHVSSTYRDITFKHILLPVWVAAYHYRGKLFRFLVNGQTGQVSGEAPLSWIKVTLLVLLILAVVGGFIYLQNQGQVSY